ncbi:MAG: pantoate--beta-alanine ligase [Tannerella sp.]|jgi:pantoate--beta-alanine ligase|nr:pantoate--beta-alanine ligase [Tannerella sp.]
MEVVYKIQVLRRALTEERKAGKRIGFVPTMGALHDGHISLVKRCRAIDDICVASIFVNPTQFNDKRDLETYPRTPENDYALLAACGCDYVFAPSVEEMYPEADVRVFELGAVAQVMEGAFRPGHFNGVAQVVSKLFEVVEPERAYFGEKDYQQVAVVREMVRQLGLSVRIEACPTLREPDGLAMSSRNVRLTPEQRRIAPRIASVLKESRTFALDKRVSEVTDRVVTVLNDTPFLRVEYFTIVDGASLQPIREWSESKEPVGCIAVYCGDVRLIDNVKYQTDK